MACILQQIGVCKSTLPGLYSSNQVLDHTPAAGAYSTTHGCGIWTGGSHQGALIPEGCCQCPGCKRELPMLSFYKLVHCCCPVSLMGTSTQALQPGSYADLPWDFVKVRIHVALLRQNPNPHNPLFAPSESSLWSDQPDHVLIRAPDIRTPHMLRTLQNKLADTLMISHHT